MGKESYNKYTKYDVEGKMRIKTRYATKIDKEITGPLLCPKCGREMEYQERHYPTGTTCLLVCPDHDIRAKVEMRNEKLYMLSTPADSKTRALRGQTHKYCDLIYKCGIMSRYDLYRYMTTKLTGLDTSLHIGEYDAPTCKLCIKAAKEILDLHHVSYD